MSASTSKKVVIRRFDREPLAGFVNPQTYLRAEGLEFLTAAGELVSAPYSEVKTVCFVRDFDFAELPADRLVFNTRPKVNGIWIRMRLRDGEVREGMLPNNLLQLEPYGFSFTPPNPASNNLRIFVPREALAEITVLGVVGSRPRRPEPAPTGQIELFEK